MNSHQFSLKQLLTPNNLFLLAFYALTITAAPIYLLQSLENAINSKKRNCDSGVITKIKQESPHITAQTKSGKANLTFPSNPLSLKKRILWNQLPLTTGQQISYCTVHYNPLGQNFLMEIKSDRQSLLDEATAKQIIEKETSISTLIAVNLVSYFFLLCYAFKFRKKS